LSPQSIPLDDRTKGAKEVDHAVTERTLPPVTADQDRQRQQLAHVAERVYDGTLLDNDETV